MCDIGRRIGMYLERGEKNTVTVFHSVNAAKLGVNELETCASFDEILVLRNKAKYTSGRFSGVGRLDLKTIEK